jgi:hypothetical protein
MVDLECSANQVVPYVDSGYSDRVCHTNHPFTNTDFCGAVQDREASEEGLQALFDPRENNSVARYDNISQHLVQLEMDVPDIELIKKLLQSHESSLYPVCRHSKPGLPWMTLGTSIMDLSPDPMLHVCPGPPCSSTFLSLDFQG